ncbi:metallophosphoesterase family protein [Bacillus sp. NPDC077027]|uniref:metallophosphoesterase family protein n=1 Tax=Bacillus sp. NPDC077027 TaxID=3390548 RepID=UPI003D044BA4
MTKLNFIHAADLHLDSPFVGMSHVPSQIFKRLKESTFQSAKKIFALAIEKQVDFVLLSGDVFDEANRSLKAQFFLRNQFLKLQQHGVKVFLSYGNHDHLGGEWTKVEWPENVYVFPGGMPSERSFYKDGVHAASIYGFSYEQRAVTENMALHYEKTTDALFHIAMLHGTLSGIEGHDDYSPFQVHQLLQKDVDYWALGHIHKRQIIHHDPLIVYPGNTQSRHVKETGEKGCYLVQLKKDESEIAFIPCSDVIFDTLYIDVSDTKHITQLVSLIDAKIDELKQNNLAYCVRVNLNGDAPAYFEEASLDVMEELLTVFREQEEEEECFVWVTALENLTNTQVILPDDSFLKELTKEIEQFNEYDQLLEPVRRHPIFRKAGPILTKEDEKDIQEEAQRLLNEQLRQL